MAGVLALLTTQAANFIFNEIPAGTQNGVNQLFTLAFSPTPSSSLILYSNGVEQNPNSPTPDYSLSSNVITMTVPPISTDTLTANYIRP